MRATTSHWRAAYEAWLAPFLARLGRVEQRRWAPVYLQGLLGPGERKSVEPMAARVAPGDVQQLHHFISTSPWRCEPLEEELVRAADRLVGGPEAVLIIDDTALVKQGRHSVGVARQYCGQLGKKANCQALVSLTLARCEVPVCVGLRLFLPRAWAEDAGRRARAGVPEAIPGRPKWRIALDEISRIQVAGARFGAVLADAEYGKVADFRQKLSEQGLTWAVGILPTQTVYPADVMIAPAMKRRTGRPPKHPVPSTRTYSVQAVVAALPNECWRTLSWRRGTKGDLRADFAALRVRVADGPVISRNRRLPGETAWLVCERRTSGERKYYLSNHAEDVALESLAALIKRRWVCEQMHQQMKGEIGLDHFEGRSWRGLHHHALMTMIAFAFLQHLRLGEKNPHQTGAAPNPILAAGASATRGHTQRLCTALSPLPQARALSPPAMKVAE
ncbi:IS701 family transposase [Paracoccus sp. MC1862]|uniref:IS701 family transposase n=4 Tax=unclassified Paracoccus (in: a-proteobacteria) TaxID=2688777 RepID=UPI0021134DC1|nr:IS701 family transposase [Paracoccus sp. MC1862]